MFLIYSSIKRLTFQLLRQWIRCSAHIDKITALLACVEWVLTCGRVDADIGCHDYRSSFRVKHFFQACLNGLITNSGGQRDSSQLHRIVLGTSHLYDVSIAS